MTAASSFRCFEEGLSWGLVTSLENSEYFLEKNEAKHDPLAVSGGGLQPHGAELRGGKAIC